MHLNLFLLLVTLTSIACDSIVASSKGLIQVKTLDVNSQRERTDGMRRNLREEVTEADIADGEERTPFNFQSLMADSKTSANNLNFDDAVLGDKLTRFKSLNDLNDLNGALLEKKVKDLKRTERFNRFDNALSGEEGNKLTRSKSLNDLNDLDDALPREKVSKFKRTQAFKRTDDALPREKVSKFKRTQAFKRTDDALP
ncbi:unnamed protein product [Peronospora farinosa]|uniref:RxLR effector protein n=1 Tax=Peronospora farinosa TaxID=134698 RepID=A0AAV0UVC4_9STRA|nr:unnamed protein product [Peronospora farinosa]